MAAINIYIDSATGSNVNAGDGKTEVESTNGNWSTTTNVFTAASGTPFSGVSVGDLGALRNDGAGTAAWIGRVTSIGGGGSSLTFASTGAGSKPTTSATGRTCKVGGKLEGPATGSGFPFNLSNYYLLRSAAGERTITWWKNSSTLSITDTLAFNTLARVIGYSSTPGDGGYVTITSSSTTGTCTTGADTILENFKLTNTGGSGTPYCIQSTGVLRNCVAYGTRGVGFDMSTSGTLIECEAYNCNTSNTAGYGGAKLNSSVIAINCFFHDNTGSNNVGVICAGSQQQSVINCVFDSNQIGLRATDGRPLSILNCDFYNNASHGIYMADGDSGTAMYLIKNCNFLKNRRMSGG